MTCYLKYRRVFVCIVVVKIIILVYVWRTFVKSWILGGIDLKCQFHQKFSTYSCIVEDLMVLNGKVKVADVIGEHTYLYSNEHVNDVVILNQTTFYIPAGFGDFFPSLKQLELMSSQLKFIKRSNFAQMKNLLDLRLDNNELESISMDTFWDLTKLQWLSISGNKITTLSEELTLTMPKLLWFTANENKIDFFDGKLLHRNLNIELISLRDNRLKKIKIDLRKFKDIAVVDLRQNLCFDEIFRKNDQSSSLIEFQDKLYSNCSMREIQKHNNLA